MVETSASGDARAPAGAVVAIFALTCGTLVANNFYAQAMGGAIAAELGGGTGGAALAAGAVQFGFFTGLALILPAADILRPGRLVGAMLATACLAALAAAAAPGMTSFVIAAMLLGACSTCGQILLPLIGQISPVARRGRVIGRVMVGLLIGTMLSRPVAALLAERLSWRAVYVGSAVLMALCLVLLRPHLADLPARERRGYGRVLVSVLTLWRELPGLRQRARYQAMLFFTLNLFWVGIPHLLATDFGPGALWLLSLAPLAGLAAAMAGGRIADAGGVQGATLGCLLVVTATTATLALGGTPDSLLLLFLAAGVIDACVQLNQVVGQKLVFELREGARARLNSAYMSLIYLSGAAGSVAGLLLQARIGWSGTMAIAAGLGLVCATEQIAAIVRRRS